MIHFSAPPPPPLAPNVLVPSFMTIGCKWIIMNFWNTETFITAFIFMKYQIFIFWLWRWQQWVWQSYHLSSCVFHHCLVQCVVGTPFICIYWMDNDAHHNMINGLKCTLSVHKRNMAYYGIWLLIYVGKKDFLLNVMSMMKTISC